MQAIKNHIKKEEEIFFIFCGNEKRDFFYLYDLKFLLPHPSIHSRLALPKLEHSGRAALVSNFYKKISNQPAFNHKFCENLVSARTE
jgi:hypothetical protein